MIEKYNVKEPEALAFKEQPNQWDFVYAASYQDQITWKAGGHHFRYFLCLPRRPRQLGAYALHVRSLFEGVAQEVP